MDSVERDPRTKKITCTMPCQQQADVLGLIKTEHQKHQSTQRGLRDIRMAQNGVVYLLALKKLMNHKPLDDGVFPKNVQEFAKRYYHQKKDLLFLNPNDILCVQYTPQQHAMHVRLCMIAMPQLYQHGMKSGTGHTMSQDTGCA